MRVIGTKDRTEIELDPAKAHRRGLALDAMLSKASPKGVRGVARGSHAYFNRVDAARQALMARAVNVA